MLKKHQKLLEVMNERKNLEATIKALKETEKELLESLVGKYGDHETELNDGTLLRCTHVVRTRPDMKAICEKYVKDLESAKKEFQVESTYFQARIVKSK